MRAGPRARREKLRARARGRPGFELPRLLGRAEGPPHDQEAEPLAGVFEAGVLVERPCSDVAGLDAALDAVDVVPMRLDQQAEHAAPEAPTSGRGTKEQRVDVERPRSDLEPGIAGRLAAVADPAELADLARQAFVSLARQPERRDDPVLVVGHRRAEERPELLVVLLGERDEPRSHLCVWLRHGRWMQGGRLQCDGSSPQILETLGLPGHPHYRVRWDDGHESIFYPGSDTHVEAAPAPGFTPGVAELVDLLRHRHVEFELLPHRRTTSAGAEARAL